MYNWRLRKGAHENETSFAGRIWQQYFQNTVDYLNRKSLGNFFYNGITSAANLTGVLYCHSELGDDSYSGEDKGSAEHPYKTVAAIAADSITNKVIVCLGRFTTGANSNVIVADSYGSAYFEAFASSNSVSGCFLNMGGNVSGVFVNCVISTSYNRTFANLCATVINCICINASIAANYSSIFSVYLNGKGTSGGAAQRYGDIFINSMVTINRNHSSAGVKPCLAYYYNSEVTVGEPTELSPITAIDLSETYQSLANCFVDPNHLNFAVKHSEVRAGTPFEDWQGFTGAAIDFAKVEGDNIQEDTGSWTIDQQTPGEGYLLSHILDNRGTFNNVFTGFINQVFHYNTNNIAITPFERYDTEHVVTVAAGTDVEISIAADTMFTVTRDCEVDGVALARYSNIILEAGTHEVTSEAGVKLYPYNYNNIGNYVQVRFANLGKCSTVAAGGTLRSGCSYLNQSGSDITISNGDTVAAGRTYVCDTANLTADGALLLVFDDARDNFVTLSTHSFQTEYMAGYVVTNSKYPTDVNLLDRDGKMIPLSEAFGEFSDVDYIPSRNWQYDYMQVRICYKVYPFNS